MNTDDKMNTLFKNGFRKKAAYDLTADVVTLKGRRDTTPKSRNQRIEAEDNLREVILSKGDGGYEAPKRSIGLSKVAGGPGSGVTGTNTDVIDFLETSPLISIGKRSKFMSESSPVQKDVKVPVSKIKYKGQEKFVPKKLVRMIRNADEVLKKPVDLLLDDKGKYHIIDGHHRALAAIILKRDKLKANIWVMGSGIKKVAVAVSTDIGKDFKDAFVKRLKEPEVPHDKFILGRNKVDPKSRERVELTAPRDRPEAFQ